MPLLNKTNPTATRESVIRHAIIGGCFGAILYPISCIWWHIARDFWFILWPIAAVYGAAIRALMEWQLDDGVEIYWIVKEVEDEFGIKIPKSEWLVIYTVGDLFDVTLAHVRAEHPTQFIDGSEFESKVWSRLKDLLIQQLHLKPEQIVKSAGFYDELGL